MILKMLKYKVLPVMVAVLIFISTLIFALITELGCIDKEEKIAYAANPTKVCAINTVITQRVPENTFIGVDFITNNVFQKSLEKIEEKALLKSNDEIAEEVVEGLWGVGEERFKKLTDAGYDAKEIQSLVDKIMISIRPVTMVTTYYTPQPQVCPCDLGASSIGECVAAAAWNYVGWLPYVWGGTSLSTGCDCSGFTMALYGLFGYDIGRMVSTQACQGISVSIDSAAPGDIVIYGGHTAVYVGGGQIIHAPVPGRCIEVASMFIMPIYDIRRIY